MWPAQVACRLHPVCTVHGLPMGWALTGAKADERQTLLTVLATMDQPAQSGRVVIADNNYFGSAFEAELAGRGITLIRPSCKGERPPSGQRFLPLRRITPRISALAAAIWHNSLTGAAVLRSLTLYDH
ncbi:hypothetical protein BKH30_07815 [Actinomyces oris]|uniref:Transposase IS4-like domain-containing protein n=1 Tax=Actinomyces oris TaxID=544580 RepID=A0A1Q8VUY0_9ACTO|nr:hypothetical protein BKH30_07815 [Actinomyces oris]